MNPASKISRVTESNPCAVLRTIGSKQGLDLNRTPFESTKYDPENDPATEPIPVAMGIALAESDSNTEVSTEPEHSPSGDVVSLRINPATHPTGEPDSQNILESTIESASQIQQLAARLESSTAELQRREVQLDERVKAWNRSSANQQAEIEQRLSQLDQQASQVRCQQLHLMQLQTDIVKSHDATRDAIESLVLETGSNPETIETLKSLKYELSGRFDYIARRWEHLAELMQSVNTQITAIQAVDDSVDWTDQRS